MIDLLAVYWPIAVGVLGFVYDALTTLHAVMQKRDSRAVIGWVGLIWLSPFVGATLYWCFGVNRIQRKASKIFNKIKRTSRAALRRSLRNLHGTTLPEQLNHDLIGVGKYLTGHDLLPGNTVTPLVGGEAAYAAMATAIESARRSISLCSYIFDNTPVGQKVVAALAQASKRGVAVRVLIDAVGALYSKPSILYELTQHGIRSATFLPTKTPLSTIYANLRNHRKIMVVDGEIGFTGGMNIREGNLNTPGCRHPIQDVHFQFDGPVVQHFQETFLADWEFATNEEVDPTVWFGVPAADGPTWARGIPDGPDEDLDCIRMVMLGAIATAKKRIEVMTPYFLPDESLLSALSVAAMRGVRVRIIIPSTCNIRLVQWASSEPISRILKYGCEVWLTPPPFEHTKIMLVDDDWSLLGSSNWDPRSLRLNFEFNVECYGKALNMQLSAFIDSKVAASEKETSDRLDNRRFLIKLRDGAARLATPYL